MRFSGFNLSEVQQLKEGINKEAEASIRRDVITIAALRTSDFIDTSSLGDRNGIYFVSGYMSKSLMKTVNCKDCCDMLVESTDSPDNLLEEEEEEDENLEESRFTALINRGGLMTPSDLMFMASLYAWNFYQALRDEK